MTAPGAPGTLPASQGLAYGLLGLPLAFVALPLYVLLPHHYASQYGMPLATLGAVLLAARLFDAFTDPLLGRWSDRLLARSHGALLTAAALACAVLALGLAALFLPPVRGVQALAAWALAALLVTSLAYSLVSIAHQAWGALLGGNEAQRSRIVAWREAAALVGVVLASVLSSLAGVGALVAVFAVLLAAGWLAWARAPRPALTPSAGAAMPWSALWQPWRQAAFRRLMAVFVPSGIASAIPATLVLFFIDDRLQLPANVQGAFLGAYFLSAALSMPLWLRAVPRWGLARTWLAGMLLSVAVAMSLTPALCATLLKPLPAGAHHPAPRGLLGRFFGAFNRGFERGNSGVTRLAGGLIRRSGRVLLVYALILGATGVLYKTLPTSFLPNEDQGTLMAELRLPAGATDERLTRSLQALRPGWASRPTSRATP